MEIVTLPASLSPHADQLRNLLAEAICVSRIEDADVSILTPDDSHFHGHSEATIVLVLAGAPVKWFTEKWLHEYVWPLLKEMVDRPTKDLFVFLQEAVHRIEKRS